MAINDNFKSIHIEEEKIRKDSIAAIEKDDELSKHFSAIHDSMDVISFIVRNHENYTPDELTVMRLGIRNFNSTAGSIKLGLSGYYQSAISQTREIFETTMLLDYFITNKDEITEWANANKKERHQKFRPMLIRQKLDKRDGFLEKKRDKAYSLLSELAAHPTSAGFQLFSPDGLSKSGPFLNEKYLKAWIQELVKLVPHGSMIFSDFFQNTKVEILNAKEHFLTGIKPWVNEFINNN